MEEYCELSQSTIKMEKGYYSMATLAGEKGIPVAIHNKNGKGLLLKVIPTDKITPSGRNPQ